MRRIRTSDPGARILFDAATKRTGSTTITIPHQIAADCDVRKLIAMLEVELAVALRGRSTDDLRPTWRITAVKGSPNRATAEISTESGDKYLDRVLAKRFAEVAPGVVARWLAMAIPTSGDGVGTPASVPTISGALPQ